MKDLIILLSMIILGLFICVIFTTTNQHKMAVLLKAKESQIRQLKKEIAVYRAHSIVSDVSDECLMQWFSGNPAAARKRLCGK